MVLAVGDAAHDRTGWKSSYAELTLMGSLPSLMLSCLMYEWG